MKNDAYRVLRWVTCAYIALLCLGCILAALGVMGALFWPEGIGWGG